MGNLISSTILFPGAKFKDYDIAKCIDENKQFYKTVNDVPILYIKLNKIKTNGTILYLHSNASDIFLIQKRFIQMCDKLSCNGIAIEYPGYSVAPGISNEKTCLNNIEKVIFSQELKHLKFFLVGRSIGTGLACQIALQHPQRFHNITLISPFKSISSIIDDKGFHFFKIFVEDVLRSDEAVKQLKMPILIIHGIKDSLIKVDHAKELYDLSTQTNYKKLVLLPQSTHENLDWVGITDALKGFYL